MKVEDYYPQWIRVESDVPGEGGRCPECGEETSRLLHSAEMYVDENMEPTEEIRNSRRAAKCRNGHVWPIEGVVA